MKQSASHHPKEEMIQTFQNVWKHASETERNYIKNMWAMIMKPVHVINWKSFGNSNEYELELEKEILGTHPDFPIGQLILKQKMKIALFEEKEQEANHYRQIIDFPDKGICFRIGIGWLSKDSAVERIFVEENQQQEIWCTVKALGQSIARSSDETLAFWKKAQWS